MQNLLNWTHDSDIVECPKEIAENLQHYVSEFDQWLSNKDSNHNYWVPAGIYISIPGKGVNSQISFTNELIKLYSI